MTDTFVSHLFELRDRLLKSLLAVILVFICYFPWARDIYSLLAQPMLDALPNGGNMIATEVTAPFFVPVKVTLLLAFITSLPYLLYQFWAFVAPGLYKNEKKLIFPIILTSTILFFIGMCFAFFIVFPVVFHFINAIAPDGVAVMTDIQKYLDFVISLFLAFGITFEVPIVVVILVYFDMTNVEKLKEYRPYVIVGAFVIGAIFTPPDVVSQILLALPLWILYELGILVSVAVSKKKSESTS